MRGIDPGVDTEQLFGRKILKSLAVSQEIRIYLKYWANET